jgi:hypothetical protein
MVVTHELVHLEKRAGTYFFRFLFALLLRAATPAFDAFVAISFRHAGCGNAPPFSTTAMHDGHKI